MVKGQGNSDLTKHNGVIFVSLCSNQKEKFFNLQIQKYSRIQELCFLLEQVLWGGTCFAERFKTRQLRQLSIQVVIPIEAYHKYFSLSNAQT